jgi:exodeoxyribonuclease III
MQIATWNVNSIRTRLSQVLDWLSANPSIDLLCLQETKVTDADFPRSPFSELGWNLYISGQKSYNGVAMLSRQPLQNVKIDFSSVLPDNIAFDAQKFDAQKRVISGEINGIRVVNLYVPNGSEVGSEKYEYKLQWLGTLKSYLQKLLLESDRLLICGDFNIALEDIDIHNPKGREAKVMATDLERTALKQIMDLGFQDAFRKFTPDPGHFSWWDYRAGGFPRNRGWRIDHHYLSPALYEQAIACTIDINPRQQPQPSDHTPVIVEL